MNCQKVEKLFSEYLENELSEKIKNEIKEHLEICGKCSQEFEIFKDSINSLKSLEVEDVKEEVWFKIKERISKEESFFEYFYSNYLKPLPGLAFTFAVIIFVFITFTKISQKIPIKIEPPRTSLNFVYKEFQDDEIINEIYERRDFYVKKLF